MTFMKKLPKFPSFVSDKGVKIRALKNKQDRKALLRLASGLPEWFDPSEVQEMSEDLIEDPGLVAELDGKRIGFLTFWKPACLPAPHRTELTWLAVDRNAHGQGVGTSLLEGLETWLLAMDKGPVELMVWTMAESDELPEYESTRAFYRKRAFEDWFVDEEDPEKWGGARLFLKKTLRE